MTKSVLFRSNEPIWVFLFTVFLLLEAVGLFTVFASGGLYESGFAVKETVIVTDKAGRDAGLTIQLGVPYMVTVIWLNLPSVFYVFFFFTPLRHAMGSCIRIIRRLASPTALIMFSILMHYFLFNGLYNYYGIRDKAFGNIYNVAEGTRSSDGELDPQDAQVGSR